MTETQNRKIYFSASIRSGREYQPMYEAIIAHLGLFGHVLTEHIGAATLGIAGETNLTEEKIFRRDVDWIRTTDVLVADVSLPSLGVGYEIGFAESLHKPILCLYYAGAEKQLTAMIAGNAACRVRIYHDIAEASKQIDRFFIPLDGYTTVV